MITNSLGQTENRRLYVFGELALHAMVWLYVFAAPLFFRHSGEEFDLVRYVNGVKVPICAGIVFYINYLWLVPQYVLRERYKAFVCWNLVLVGCVVGLNEVLHSAFLPPHRPHHIHHHGDVIKDFRHRDGMPRHRHGGPHPLFFVISNILFSLSAMGLAIVVRLSGKWRESQLALQRAEQERAEIELNNLKNQVNPHFLLNTLNNIYALTSFDPAGARLAIEELSKMLRYILYENATARVDLRREVEFIRSYIALMRLRLSDGVEVTCDMDIPEEGHFEIAPLILISLVENAFKHGISPTHRSYVRIRLVADAEQITFCCTNTNHPKPATDKSPGGIGLKQVESRLALSYPGKHTWRFGVNADNEYVSEIVFKN